MPRINAVVRRFQFSLRRLMGAVFLFAVSFCLWRAQSTAILAFPIVLGSAIGQLFGMPFLGAAVALLLLSLAPIVAEMVGIVDSIIS